MQLTQFWTNTIYTSDMGLFLFPHSVLGISESQTNKHQWKTFGLNWFPCFSVGFISQEHYKSCMVTFRLYWWRETGAPPCIFSRTGPAKSDFDLLVRFYLKHFFTCPYDIYIVNSWKKSLAGFKWRAMQSRKKLFIISLLHFSFFIIKAFFNI